MKVSCFVLRRSSSVNHHKFQIDTMQTTFFKCSTYSWQFWRWQLLRTVKDLPNTIARKGKGAAAMWGPDGGDLFEQVLPQASSKTVTRSIVQRAETVKRINFTAFSAAFWFRIWLLRKGWNMMKMMFLIWLIREHIRSVVVVFQLEWWNDGQWRSSDRLRHKIGSMPAANALTSEPFVNTVAALDY